MPLEAARLDPEGRGAARRGGCFNPPQYRPETNLLGFRVLIWSLAGRMIREALDRARQQAHSANAEIRIFILRRPELKESHAAATLAQAGEGSTAGCGDFAASKRRRIVQASEGCSDLIASASRALRWSELSCRSVWRVKFAAALA